MKKHPIGQHVECEKDGVSFEGIVTQVNAEMSYEITLPDGSIRAVDHCHILTALPKEQQ